MRVDDLTGGGVTQIHTVMTVSVAVHPGQEDLAVDIDDSQRACVLF
jgi:hypothetical protein